MIHLLLLAAPQQPERPLEHELYRAQMFAAESALRLGEPAVAREWLDATNPEQRGFEWRVRDTELDESSWKASIEAAYVSALAMHKDGGILACGTSKGALEVRDAGNFHLQHTFTEHADAITQLGFDSIGRRLVTASADRTVKIWDFASRSVRFVFRGHKFPVGGAAFSPDGALVASCSYERPPDGVIGTLHVWNPDDGTIVRTLTGGRKPLVGLAFSPDGKHIAAGSWDFCVFVWSVDGGEPVRCAMPKEDKYNAVDDVAWSPDSKLVAGASRDGTARVWNAVTGELVASLRAHSDAVAGVAFDPVHPALVTTSADGSIGIWNTGDWSLRARPSGHVDDVGDVVFGPDGKTFYTASIDRSVRAWDAASPLYGGARMKNEAATYVVRFSPDDSVLATCSYDGRIQLWSVGAHDLLASWPAHPAGKSCHALGWTSDSYRLVSGSWEPVVRVWDVFTQQELGHFDVPTGTTALAVAPNDSFVAVAGGKTVTVWRLDGLTKVHEFEGHAAPVSSVRISPNSQRCVSTARDGKALVWELDTGKLLEELDAGSPDVVDAVFTSNNRFIVVACRDGGVSQFLSHGGAKVGSLARSRHGIDHIAVPRDGSRAVLASEHAQIIDLEHGGFVGELRPHVGGTYDLDFDSTGSLLATCSTDKTIAITDARPFLERNAGFASAMERRAAVGTQIGMTMDRLGNTVRQEFDLWKATPAWERKPRGQAQPEWMEYWIQIGASQLR